MTCLHAANLGEKRFHGHTIQDGMNALSLIGMTSIHAVVDHIGMLAARTGHCAESYSGLYVAVPRRRDVCDERTNE